MVRVLSIMCTKVCRLSGPIAVATLALLSASSVLAARILCVFPDPSRSHVITYEPLTRALAARGHDVTVVSSFPLAEPVDNYTEVVITSGYGIDRFFADIYGLRHATPTHMVRVWWHQMNDLCSHYLTDPRIRTLIASDDQHFDLVILEVILYECFVGFAYKFRAPLVLLSSSRGTHWIWDMVGNPAPYAYVPSHLFGFSDRMTFPERVVNTLEPTLISVLRPLVIMPRFDSLMRKYFDDATMPPVTNIARNVSLLLAATHDTLDYPRPSVPALISVGGMHIKPPRKLPNDLQEFLDDAQDGAVYFSLGSTLRGSFIPASLINVLVAGFSRLKLRVLWSWDGDNIADLPANVRVGAWLPQGDVLAHPNVRVFLTQGGYSSMQESVYHGVPMVGIPIYGDQFWNVRLAEELGFGLRLELDNITAESLMWALNTASQDSYRESARLASARFRDNPQPPLEKAVYWTEYIIRYKGAPHLRVAALDLTWYQYLMLDVVMAAVVLPISLLVAIGVLFVRR